jgi:hypothetical protein
MDLKQFKLFFMILAALMVFVLPVNAAITGLTAVVTPTTADTSDSLDCGFTVVGSVTTYTVNVTWFNGTTAHTADDQTGISAANNTLTHTSTVGDLESGDTVRGDAWKCQVTASDGLGNSMTSSSTAVTIQNSAPAITSSAKTTGRTEAAYSYTVTATDADGDTLAYSLTTSPTGMTIGATSGTISWTPTENQTGSNSVVVLVEDGNGGTDTQSFTISVSKLKLAISKISADCSPENCDDGDLDEDTGGSIKEVKPGSTLELEIRLESLWDDDADDHDIEEIEIETTLEDMGDEDEQDVDESVDDIKPGDKSDKVILEYDIPEETDEGTYDLDVTITAEDEDGTDYEIEFTIEVDVEKEKHKLWIKQAELTPTVISCNRNIDILTEAKNIGSKDEDDCELVIRSSDLDISSSEFFDLEEGAYDDDDTERRKNYEFKIGDDVKAGTYEIEIKLYYEDDEEYERTTVTLTVQKCSSTATPPDDEDEEEEESEDVDVYEDLNLQTGATQTGGPVVAQPVTSTTQITEGESFTDSTAFLVILIVAILALLGVGGFMVYVLVKK